MENEEYNTNEYPLKYLKICLTFLAMEEKDRSNYLPRNFKKITFHMATGDIVTGNPLLFMAVLINDFCKIYVENSEIDKFLKMISGILEVLDYNDDVIYWQAKDVWDGKVSWESPCISLWSALSYLAKEPIKLFHWKIESPSISCIELLDSYSYGAYTYHLLHPEK